MTTTARDLDMSDVLADADRMRYEMEAREEERLEREIGPMHWVMDEYEAWVEDNYAFQN